MTRPQRDNVLIVHWHDLGRYLGVYGHPDVSSPRLDQLANEGILFTRAHATAPLCSPSRGSLFTGRYPHDNGLIGLAHHGWEYRADVQTLPRLLSESGWHTALFGMQHETSYPARLGFDEYDVSNSYCEYVVERATDWLADPPTEPFLLTAGFFETHRPYPHDRYEPADADDVAVPDYLPDTDDVRQDLADFYGSIAVADAAVGQLLDTLESTGLDRTTWVVFMTDHGPALPGPSRRSTTRVPGSRSSCAHRWERTVSQWFTTNCSAVSTCFPPCWTCLASTFPKRFKVFRTRANCAKGTRASPRAPRSTPRRRITTRSIRYVRVRTKEYSYIENYAARPVLDLPWDIADSAPGQVVEPLTRGPRPAREMYDLVVDPTERDNLLDGEPTDKAEAIAGELAMLLDAWRQKTNDVIPSDFAGTRIAERFTETYLHIHGRPATSRSAIAADRGIHDEIQQ